MWSMIFSMVFGLAKWVGGKAKSKKLSDKEFVAFILAYQNQKSHAGEAALDFEDALEQGQKDLDEELIAPQIAEADAQLKRVVDAGEGL